MSEKVIITAAVTGAIHVPTLSPYLPITPREIIDDAVKAYEAGAAAVHIHVRNPATGEPTNDIDLMEEVYNGIKKECPVIICTTTGGKLASSLESRLAPVFRLKPELASLNAGSMNFSVTALLGKLDDPKFAWERPFIESTYDTYTTNSFKALEMYIGAMKENGTKSEFEVFDLGMLYNIKYFIDQGILHTPIYLQFVFGIMGGVGTDISSLMMFYNKAVELIGRDNFVWSVGIAGKPQFDMGTVAVIMGGNVRVGLEDNLYLSRGTLAKSSAEQVTKIRSVIETLDREIATPDEARAILGIKKKG